MATYSKIFVYLRFSSDGQADGSSFDRQRAAAEAYLRTLGIDKSSPDVVWIEDPGYSAFHGDHLRVGKLGKLVEQVRSRQVSNGLLICEGASRASRQGAFAFLALIQEFLNADFTVQLLDGTQAFNKNNIPAFFGTLLALRGDIAQAESQAKSEYSLKNWARRREQARAEGTAFTSECPRWLKVVDGRYEPIPDRVKSITNVFKLALDGWGVTKIVGYANENQWPVPAKTAGWHSSLVNRLFNNRALIGEFQPYQQTGGKRTPLGEPIPGYYPAVIDAHIFHAVQNVRAKASQFPRRRDENNYNFLMGMAKCECGAAWRRINKNSGKQVGYAIYSCANRVRRLTDCPNMPARAFDHVFISVACQHIPALLATEGQSEVETERLAIDAQLEDLQRRRETLAQFIVTNPDLGSELGDKLRTLISERQVLEKRRAQLAVNEVPEDFSFGEAVAVFLPAFLDVLDPKSTDGEAAFRARALFRARLIESVQLVEVARDRKSFILHLKNGARLEHPTTLFTAEGDDIEDLGFGALTDWTDEEVSDLSKARSEALASIKRLGKARKA